MTAIKHWKPILALLLVTPFLTELLSGSRPATAFFRPQVYLFLATVGYGFPILLLREFAVRRQLGLAGWFILGLVYGIFNEGIVAKTYYLAANVPVKNFDGYGYTCGIAIPWAITITIWHAMHSFIYPLTAITYFFPEDRQSSWLSRGVVPFIAIPPIAVGALMFVHQNKDRPAGHAAHFVLLVALICLLLWLAARLKTRPALGEPEPLWIQSFFLGDLAFLSLVLVPVLLAGAKAPLSIFYGYNLLLVVLALWLLRRHASVPVNTALLFAIGDDTWLALFGLAGAMGAGSIQRIATSAAFLLVFGWLWTRLRKSPVYFRPVF